MKYLRFILGKTIIKIEKTHEYIQITLSGGAILSIFNNYYYSGKSVFDIEGYKINCIEELNNSIVLSFEEGEFISIGLNDSDFNGPEAIILKREGMPSVVWN